MLLTLVERHSCYVSRVASRTVDMTFERLLFTLNPLEAYPFQGMLQVLKGGGRHEPAEGLGRGVTQDMLL
jgi:hypothetical protein